VSLQRVLVTR